MYTHARFYLPNKGTAHMAKTIKPNTLPLGLYPIKALPRGEYVKRVDVCKACQGAGKLHVFGAPYNGETCGHCEGKGYTKEYRAVWIKGDYNRKFPHAGKFELTRFDDVNTTSYRSGSVLVLAGFTF
jgi:hypothetical protein